ncbi:UbiH/UbiF/VisC/COQ6 family ubiquinone biosynthesis hydroxylase [Candidatus Thiosymbion oneisti]|uniref:UbiH/UbiF/VisC/COQ6 family ubiquinone biosynthesis hydroxylase n=1 Tax=Candidatus Thiosymbion oneisti TaxID=589554 RepID=UPI000B261D34|nr:UbiH/UbiF/VisC/COQ6 family ubiquinone biosynthesis hydroxylase [Candidatus Thiosymbion oneisti]
MTERDLRFDILVVGGGMVGAALACACVGKGWRIALVEAQAPQRSWPSGEVDLRVSALNRASQRILERLGVWDRITRLGASPYREMHVWDAVGGGSIHFDSAELGEPDLGHIVENRVTQLALWERLERSEEVTLLCPSAVGAIELTTDAALLDLKDGRRISARLLVGADGRDSRVRSRAGIASRGWLYDQQAIVANVQIREWHRETAWQRFLPTGPLAFLPLRDGRCAIVWSATEFRAQELLGLEEAGFRSELEAAIEGRLGPIGDIGPRAAFGLQLQHAEHYVKPRLALIGDAAHAVHPLAGQGVNLGLLDAAALTAALDEARDRRRDIGGLWALRRYERARRGDNLLMLAAMDGFKRMFSNAVPPLAVLRSMGLSLVDRLVPIKHLFMQHALGAGGDLPPLARPGLSDIGKLSG